MLSVVEAKSRHHSKIGGEKRSQGRKGESVLLQHNGVKVTHCDRELQLLCRVTVTESYIRSQREEFKALHHNEMVKI